MSAPRKICKSCKCSQEDHCLSSDLEDDRKIGRLLMDSKYSTLTARVKGGDGVRIYKRNRMIMTNPIATGKDPTFDTITYEWAPPGVTQKLVSRPPPCPGTGEPSRGGRRAALGYEVLTGWASVFLIHAVGSGVPSSAESLPAPAWGHRTCPSK